MFKATIEQTKLVKALKDISGSIGKGDGETAWDASIYMKSYNDNGVGKVKLLSTNRSEWTWSVIDAIGAVEEGVSPLVTYSLLSALINTINPTYEITLEEKSIQLLTVNYIGRKTPIELPAIMSGSFITEPSNTPIHSLQVPCDLFKLGIDKASKVITDGAELVYNCVNVTFNANNILFEAIDRPTQRVMAYVINHANPVEGNFLIECTKMKNMIAGFDGSKPIDIQVSKNNIAMSQGEIVALLRLTANSFPPVLSWLPNTFKNKVIFQKDEMINSLKRIQLMFDSKTVTKSKVCFCEFDTMFTTINSNAMKGRITESVMTTLTGDAFKAAFNLDVLLKSLYTIDTPDVQLVQYDTGNIYIAPNNPQGYEQRMIVMQIVVRDKDKVA